MKDDFKSARPRHLDPRAQAAINHIQARSKFYVGAICLRNLPAVLPRNGDRRGWRDAVTVFLLCEIVSVHRVAKGSRPYWSGALYQINRHDLAEQFACDPDDISTSLQWLKKLGLVHVIHRTPFDGVGKPCGTMVYAVPLMDRIHMLLVFFAQNGRPMDTSQIMDSNPLEEGSNSASTAAELNDKSVPTRGEAGSNLNCLEKQQNNGDEIGDEVSAQRQSPVVSDDRGSLAVDGGGGGADAGPDLQVPPLPAERGKDPKQRLLAPLPQAVAQNAPDSTSKAAEAPGMPPMSKAPTARWTPPEMPPGLSNTAEDIKAWRKGSVFCKLWCEAIVRLHFVTICKPTPKDQQRAFKFFCENPQIGPFFSIAVASSAWCIPDNKKKNNKWDSLFHCRQAYEIKQFFAVFESGKLEPEIGRADWEINAFEDLRAAFTESELKFFGFDKTPVLAIDRDYLWEYQPDTPDYYRVRKFDLPPEVAAAAADNDASDAHSEADRPAPEPKTETVEETPEEQPMRRRCRAPAPEPDEEHAGDEA